MYQFKIDGMTCEGCVSSVKKAILKVDPKAKVEIRLETGIAQIDGAVNPEPVKAAIEAAGFDVL